MQKVIEAPENQGERSVRLAEVQRDVERLLELCSEKAPQDVDESLLARIVPVLRADAASLTADQEEDLWRARVLLGRCAQPATCTGLRFLALLEANEHEGRDLLTEIEQLKRWVGYFLVALLASVALTHVHSLLGKALVERARSDLLELGAALPGPKPEKPPPAVVPAEGGSVAATAAPLSLYSLPSACHAAWQDIGKLRSWRFAFEAPRADDPCRVPTGDLSEPTRLAAFVDRVRDDVVDPLKEEIARAELVQRITTTFLLPMLYGALGAFVFALRQMANLVEAGALRSVLFRFRYRVRLFLGAIFGLAIATFLDVRGVLRGVYNDTGLMIEPILAAAFLTGYSIEAVFAVLDFVIVRLRDFVSARKRDDRPQSERAPARLGRGSAEDAAGG
jgi:hypothetical protein